MNSGTKVTLIIAYSLHTVILGYKNEKSYVNYFLIAYYSAVICYLLNLLIFLDVLYCSHLIILAC